MSDARAVEHVNDGRHRRRSGRSVGRLSPETTGPAVRRSSTRTAAWATPGATLGFAAAVHAGAFRGARRHALPGAAARVPDQGRDGGLPRGVRRAGSRCRCARHARRPAVAPGTPIPGRRRRPAIRGRSGGRRHGQLPAAAGAGLRRRSRSRHPAAAFVRLPPSGAAPGRPRAARGGRQLGRGDRAWRRRAATARGWPAATRATCPSGSTAAWRSCSSCRLVLRVVFHRILSIATPIGRRVRPRILHGGGPLVRTKPSDLMAAGVERTPRMAGVRKGLPLLEDGRVLDVANVIWCTGSNPGFSWIDLPVFDEDGPRGTPPAWCRASQVCISSACTSSTRCLRTMIHGVGRDAARVANALARRARTPAAKTREVAAA